MRTRVYDSIVALLSDRKWHWASEVANLTTYPEQWLSHLARDPDFELDATKAMIRLRGDAEHAAA